MKRKVMIFGLFIFVALVSAGCFGGGSTDSLRCTFEEEDYGMMTSGEYVIDFEKLITLHPILRKHVVFLHNSVSIIQIDVGDPQIVRLVNVLAVA